MFKNQAIEVPNDLVCSDSNSDSDRILDKTMVKDQKKLLDKTMNNGNGQKLSIGDLVSHVTVPALGMGIVVSENPRHKDFWVVKWCDERYHDVGQLGIHAKYLSKIN